MKCIVSGKIKQKNIIAHDYSLINCNYHGGEILLMHSALDGHDDALQQLLEYGFIPDIADNYGQTELMGAAYEGHRDIVKSLLSFDAN